MIKECIMCGGEYESHNKKRGKTARRSAKRPSNVFTCGRNCSKRYAIIRHNLTSNLYAKIRKLTKELKDEN